MRRTGSPELMKRLNQSAILRTIREQGPLSRAKIAKALQLNPSTVTRIVDGLIKEGLVIEGEAWESSARGGRRAVPLEFNYKASLIVGVDLRGTTMVGALADLEGNILRRSTIHSKPGDSDGNLERLAVLIGDLIETPRSREQKIRGIGIGAPAITLSQEGIVTWAPALGWRNLPLKKLVEERFGIPTFIENDINLAALGESWRGAGQEVSNLVCISIGTGIGAGIIIDGELYRGATEAAGEVGYLVPSESHLGRTYDQFGCLESLAAGPGIARRAVQAIRQGTKTAILDLASGDEGAIAAEHVFEAARQGDSLAQEIMAETVKYLSIAVSSVASILNPEMIIIDGAMARSGDLLLEPIKEMIGGVVPVMPQLVLSQLDDDPVVMGAIALALRSTEDFIFIKGERRT